MNTITKIYSPLKPCKWGATIKKILTLIVFFLTSCKISRTEVHDIWAFVFEVFLRNLRYDFIALNVFFNAHFVALYWIA